MFKKTITFALRHLRRHKGTAAISAAGLTAGITAFLFIFQYVAFEFSANTQHTNSGQIHRVLTQNQDREFGVMLPPGVAPLSMERVTGLKAATRFTSELCGGIISVENEGKALPDTYREENCIFGDEYLADVFTLPMKYGSSDLSNPAEAILSLEMANKFFGTAEKATGQTFTIYNSFGESEIVVGGVMEKVPASSDLQPGIIVSMKTLEMPGFLDENSWADPFGLSNGFTQTYFLLENEVLPAQIASSLNQFREEVKPTDDITFLLQPLEDVHLGPSLSYALPTYGNLGQVLLLLAIAAIIMVIAWANYINLSTAQGMDRAKQIGVQKSLGATRGQLLIQYMGETLVFSFCCLILSLGLIELIQPYFNDLIGKELSLAMLNQGFYWLFGLLFFLGGVVIAGGYVSVVLTGLKPGEVLKGKVSVSAQGKQLRLRQLLVVFQFAVSVLFILSTLIFNKQLDFMKQTDLGMELDNRLVIQGPEVDNPDLPSRAGSFKEELNRLSFVRSHTGSNQIPGGGYNFNANGITRPNAAPEASRLSFGMLLVDENYLSTYDIELIAGQNFTAQAIDLGWGSDEMILNESAARQLGFDPVESAVGQVVKWGQYGDHTIRGLIKDYHHFSLQQNIDPMILLPLEAEAYYTLHLTEANTAESIASLKNLYQEYFPGNPFLYFFAPDHYDRQYASELRFESLFLWASAIAVIIACLGLFGLAAFTARARTKEIGIRKVLGASVSSIVLLLSRDFLKLVLLGFIIAVPLAAWAMSSWLQNFAYKTDLGIGVFILTALIAIGIALITVSSRALKSALQNPVNSLKSD